MKGRSPERVRNELIVSIVDALQGSATVQQPGSREIWREMLAGELAAPVEPFGGDRLRPWLLQIVRECTGVGDGLACLVRSLEYVEQQSATVAALWPLVDEWEAVDFFGSADLGPLRPVLLSLRSPDLSAMARRASSSRVQELPAWCQTGWQVFLRLAGENSPNGELPPGMAFLALCADRRADGRRRRPWHGGRPARLRAQLAAARRPGAAGRGRDGADRSPAPARRGLAAAVPGPGRRRAGDGAAAGLPRGRRLGGAHPAPAARHRRRRRAPVGAHRTPPRPRRERRRPGRTGLPHRHPRTARLGRPAGPRRPARARRPRGGRGPRARRAGVRRRAADRRRRLARPRRTARR